MSTATPSATRRGVQRVNTSILPMTRNSSRLAIGGVVLVLSALLASAIYTQIGNRVEVLALAHDVEQGDVIKTSDLKTAEVSVDSDVSTVAASRKETFVGRVATTRLLEGSLLTSSSVSDVKGIATGEAKVGAALKTGQFPSDIRPGDPVMLITSAADALTQPVKGTVVSLEAVSETSDTTSASFVVPAESAAAIGVAGASGNLVVVALPR